MNEEVQKLAQQLIENGITSSRMDAVRMAESMLNIKTDSTKKSKISNLDYDDEPPVERKPSTSLETPVNVGLEDHEGKTLNELNEIKEEIAAVLEEPDSKEEELTELEIEEPELIKKEEEIITEEVDEDKLEEDIEETENKEETPEEQEQEKEIEQELEEPELVKKEEELEKELEPEVKEDLEFTVSPYEQAVKDFEEDPDVPEKTEQIPASSENKGSGLSEEEKEMTDITKLFNSNK